jgi:hypothetical protein
MADVCPFCGAELNVSYLKFECGSYYCNGRLDRMDRSVECYKRQMSRFQATLNALEKLCLDLP